MRKRSRGKKNMILEGDNLNMEGDGNWTGADVEDYGSEE